MKYQCLVVDDEPITQKIIEQYISEIDVLNLICKCGNAFEALNVLHKEMMVFITLMIIVGYISTLLLMILPTLVR